MGLKNTNVVVIIFVLSKNSKRVAERYQQKDSIFFTIFRSACEPPLYSVSLSQYVASATFNVRNKPSKPTKEDRERE